MTEDAIQEPTAQQGRKARESFNVQRLTTWIGAAVSTKARRLRI